MTRSFLQLSRVNATTIAGAVLISLGAWSAVTVQAQDMAPTTEDHVRRATVMVLTEIPGNQRGGGSGTGSFINGNGLVITNNHVVDPNHGKSREERAKNYQNVTLPKYHVIVDSGTPRERMLSADLLHQSESGDVALLQVKGEDGEPLDTPHYLSFIPPETLTDDAKVWIFGFPGGLMRGKEVAITSGLVTELMRTASGAVMYVETDATVHPGNSGGPVVDRAGRLFGVATHKRFEDRAKDRSGAVPAPLVEQFILTGFQQGRMPKTVDTLPLTSIFTDYNGIVEYPTYERAKDDAVIRWPDGNVRRGKLKSETLSVSTVFGDLDVPLARAAYVFRRGDRATLVMDGGDRLTFPEKRLSVSVEIGGRPEKVGLDDISVMAFAKPDTPVTYPTGKGVIIQGDECRLGLGECDGQLSVGGSRYPLTQVVAIASGDGSRSIVRTAKGERLEGTLGRQKFTAETAWSAKPLSIGLGDLREATIRPIEWAFVNAQGRRLVEQLDLQDEILAQIADLLDRPDWKQAEPLLEQAGQAKLSRDGKQQLKLLAAVMVLRAGDFPAASTELKRLSRKDDNVGGVAQAYFSLLEEYPDGTFMGASLSQPDAAWRASSAAARKVLADVDERFGRIDDLPYRKKAKELEKLEEAVDAANRLELGMAQSKLMQVLEKAYFSNIEGYEETRLDYNRTVDEHNRQSNRTQQDKFQRKLKSMDGQLKQIREEIERLYKRLVAESAGFNVDPPKLD